MLESIHLFEPVIPVATLPGSDTAQLALDTIMRRPTDGVATWMLHIMEHSQIERLAGADPGAYKSDPVGTYVDFQLAIGTCWVDQFIPLNSQAMGTQGYESETEKGATTGAHEVIADGIVIDSAEAVVEHMEFFVFPELETQLTGFEAEAHIMRLVDDEGY